MKTRRLFFALWPSAQVRHSIVETFSQFPRPIKGRIMQPHNLHVTLHFIGSVTGDVKDCMHTAAQTIRSNSFECDLDRFGSFRRARILWMGCQNVSVELTQLHHKLAVALENCGYQSEKRVFSPHVTLMRKYVTPLSNQIAEQIDFSIPWRVEEFVLIESITYKEGVNYQVIEKYPLS
jgi:RNA 2',3'-cyclic 3'-phosphodiesterase